MALGGGAQRCCHPEVLREVEGGCMGLPMTTETDRKSSTLLGQDCPLSLRAPAIWGVRFAGDEGRSPVVCAARGCPWEIN